MPIHPTRVWAGRIACTFCVLCAVPAGAQTTDKTGPNQNVPSNKKWPEGTGVTADSQNNAWGAKGFEMKIPEVPKAMVLMPEMVVPAPRWAPADPCASQADEAQLNAMHRLLEATLRTRSMDAMAFADKVPKGCNGQRLRYYLNVTAQLFPEGAKK